MSELIAFWHGVAAMLIGEISALIMAFSWKKIFNKMESAQSNKNDGQRI